jgi:hypothetical protein
MGRLNIRNIRWLLLLLVIGSTPAMAQWKSYKMSVKGDTINRVDKKGREQGPWVIRQEALRGERGFEEEGVFSDGYRTGPWRRYSIEGDLLAVENYRYGMKDGLSVYFNLEGKPIREERWRAIDPKSPYDTVPVRDLKDPNKITGYQVVKVEPASRKHGTWNFYDERTGRLEATEEWVMGKPKAEVEDNTAPIAVVDAVATPEEKKAVKKKELPKPKEVVDFEKKHKGKSKKFDVRTGETGG